MITRRQWEKMTAEEYTEARNKLIPHAIKAADRAYGADKTNRKLNQETYAREWNRAYLAAMHRMACEAGIVREVKGK
jgi:hypothetical protein